MLERDLTIGIIDDEKNIRRTIGMVLESEGYQVWDAENCKSALETAAKNKADGIILDMRLPDGNGLELIPQLNEKLPGVPIILISGHGTLADAVEATKRGAFDFLEKPVDKDRLLVTLRNALEMGGLRKAVARLEGGEMVGRSSQMDDVRAWIERVSPTDSRVLVLGESGTGKELVARAIHRLSRRTNKPFIKVNCAAIPKELVESVLFGHVRGAFTGALKDKVGTFKQADKGTLFLDEIADMGLEAQAKVLRVLQEGEFEAVGSTRTEKVDVRVIAATHRDLKERVAEGTFREDLYYRLAVLVLELPALRERFGDVAVLTSHFFEDFHSNGLPYRTMSKTALSAMERYTWPGNIRELRNVVERLAILTPGSEVQLDDLPSEIRQQEGGQITGADPGAQFAIGTSLADVRTAAETAYLTRVLDHTDGNVSEAARLVSLERTHLHKKLVALGIKKKG